MSEMPAIADCLPQSIELPEIDWIRQVRAEKRLANYIRLMWHVAEPKKPIIWNWHLDAICEHLEAVTAIQIQYLLINIPPRHTKSLAVNVFWPTWEWGPKRLPHLRYITTSYAQGLSTRDSLRSRRIIQSPFYQKMWGDVFKITSDQNQKTRYDNDHTGYRIATSVDGIGTGEGGDRIISDDPHNIREAESDAKRTATIDHWDESMSTRLDDESTGAYVIVCQRCHHQDLSGHIIDKAEAGEIELTKLILPARYEKERELKLKTKTPLNFVDPRTSEGEPLDCNRFPENRLRQRESRMTNHAIAGQLQQRPSPRGGGLFQAENMIVVNRIPGKIMSSVRYWDKAGTDGQDNSTAAYTAGVLLHLLEDGRVIVADVVRGQWEYGPRNKKIKQVAAVDGISVSIWLEQEPGSGGKESAQISVRELAGYKVGIDRVTGNKIDRAEAYAAAIEHGLVLVLNASWTRQFIQEHETAPHKNPKDQWDSTAGAFNKLMLGSRGGTW
jgi:predicted phage terminase large subunit-like protein